MIWCILKKVALFVIVESSSCPDTSQSGCPVLTSRRRGFFVENEMDNTVECYEGDLNIDPDRLKEFAASLGMSVDELLEKVWTSCKVDEFNAVDRLR